MKQRIFMMLAAMLLSIGAFAQSAIQGDVNNDGVVDVADIVKIIDIMQNSQPQTTYYWYVGTTKPTSLSQATVVDEYESPYIYTNNSGAKSHIFVLTNSDKTVIFEEVQLAGIVSQVDVDETTIPGYKIWETAVGTANTGRIRIYVLDDGWKHFYVGTTQPTAENYKTLTPQYSSLSDMNGATVQVPSNGKIYVTMPKSETLNQSQIKNAFIDNEGNIVTCIDRTGDNQTIPVHMIWELTFEPGATLTFKDPRVDE